MANESAKLIHPFVLMRGLQAVLEQIPQTWRTSEEKGHELALKEVWLSDHEKVSVNCQLLAPFKSGRSLGQGHSDC